MIPFAFLALAAQIAAVAPPANTTDVDQTTTPAEASPLAPQPLTPPASPPSLDDILKAAPPYDPTAGTPPAPEEQPRPGVVLSTPKPSSGGGEKPSFLTDRNSRPDGPPTDADTLYENRVLGAFRAAEQNQGPLDGRWLVAKAGGGPLYTLQFSDSGRDQIEGAWRDMDAAGKGGTGFIDAVERGGGDTVVRFTDGSKAAEVRVHPAPDGGWVGEAITPAGKVNVVMTRDVGVDLAASAAPLYIPPPAPVGRPARHGKAAKAHAARKGSGKSKAKTSSAKKKKKK